MDHGTFVELFAGVGGFRVALEKLGLQCVLSCEIEGQARATYKLNWPESDDSTLYRDITTIPNDAFPPHDLLCGGFPCQPYTRLGAQEGLAHRKGPLYREILRVLRHRHPPMVLLENVPGLVTTRVAGTKQTVLGLIMEDLRQEGYGVWWRIVDSATLLPQTRKRLYIVALRGAGFKTFRFPALPSLGRGVTEVLHASTSSSSCSSVNRRLEIAAMEACRLSQAQWDARLAVAPAPLFLVEPSLPSVTLTKSYRDKPSRKAAAKVLRAMEAASGAGSRSGENPRWGWHTLVPWGDGEDEVSSPPRFYTPRECARLQGFPESFKIFREKEDPSGCQAALFGNAVSVPIVTAISARLMNRDWGPVVLQTLLDSIPPESRPALTAVWQERVQGGVLSTAGPEGHTEAPMELCFRWRDTGACAWGSSCRWSHEPVS
mmetsp:Transcript_30731/g.86116  ORF Transcript_30731/g.86116 Transcript_30731/m.86116 type:complete len:432 (-) Transcript_30731:1435-2730(-)